MIIINPQGRHNHDPKDWMFQHRIVFTGDDSGIQLSVESSRHAKLDLDIDDVSDYEVARYVLCDDPTNLEEYEQGYDPGNPLSPTL